jgi:hypothetical protein
MTFSVTKTKKMKESSISRWVLQKVLEDHFFGSSGA